jgi:N-acetylglucosamine-6-phosphate deacetylase
MDIVLPKSAKAVLPNEELENASIVISDGMISQINAGANDFARPIDLQGAQLFPGFIDVHNHGAIGVDANDADANALHKVSKFLAANGVTAWLPSLVPDSSENYQKAIRAIDELMQTQDGREAAAARVVGVHYEGPFVSEKQCGALRVEYFRNFQNGDELADLPKLKTPGAVHLITLAPEVAGGIRLIEKLRADDWIVSIGHTRADR